MSHSSFPGSIPAWCWLEPHLKVIQLFLQLSQRKEDEHHVILSPASVLDVISCCVHLALEHSGLSI